MVSLSCRMGEEVVVQISHRTFLFNFPRAFCICASAEMRSQIQKQMCGTVDKPSQALTFYLKTTRCLYVGASTRSGQSFNLHFTDHQVAA